jgi:uncharacterized protein YoxC
MGFLLQARINNIMAYQSNVVANAQMVEYGKFLEIQGDSRFPAISVTRYDYRDSAPALSSVEVYPKYAIITYLANPEDIKVSLSAENLNVNLADVESILNVISPNVADIKTQTDAVESTLTTISNNIGTTNTNVADIETLLIRTNALVNSVSANVADVGTINTNVADIETLLIRSNSLVNSVSADVRTMDTRVFNINSHVSTIDTRTSAMTALLTTSNALVNSVSANVADVGTINTRVGTISTMVNSVSTNVADIKTLLTTCNTNVGTINTNVNDIDVLLTRTNTLVNSVSVLLGNQLGINGVVFCQPSNGTVTQNFNAIQVLSACKFSAITIANSTTTGLTNYELPQNFTLTAPITSLALSYGAIIAFK